MDNLPDEILIMIFSYVSPHQLSINATKVCHRWKRLILHYVLRIHQPGDEENLHRDLQALLVTSYVSVLSNPSEIISRISFLTVHLAHLTLSIDYSLGEIEFKMLKNLKMLNHLDIFSSKKILTDDTPISPKITSFVANEVMAPGFLKGLKNCYTMRAFHMYGRSVFYPPKELTVLLRHHSVSLRELTLRCSDLPEFRYEAIGLCEGLTSLQLYTCSQLSSRGICHIMRLTNLRRLHLTGMRMIRVKSLVNVINSLPKRIEELNLSCSWFGDEHSIPLLTRLPNLRHLELWRCRISAYNLMELTRALTSLESLDTDVLFESENLKLLETNTSLTSLRCRLNSSIRTRFNITSSLEKIPYQFLRSDEEGPQSNLFYYWTQGVAFSRLPIAAPLRTIPNSIRKPNFWSMELSDWI